MTTIYMVRHGETEFNKRKVYYGWSDPLLTPEGEQQCRNVKEKLKKVNFDAIVTSTLERTICSAQIITGTKRENLDMYDELKELNFGLWEGKNYKEIEKCFNEEWICWIKDWIGFCIPEGESFDIFYKRVKTCLIKLLDIYKNKNILLVCHEGTLKIIAILLLNMQIEDYWKFTFEFGMFSKFEIEEDFTVIKKINC